MLYLSGAALAKYLMQPPYPGHHQHCFALKEARRRSHPHTVRQPGLLRSRLNDEDFLAELDERRRWLSDHGRASFWVDDLIEHGEVSGKLYRFADLQDADWFRFRF